MKAAVVAIMACRAWHIGLIAAVLGASNGAPGIVIVAAVVLAVRFVIRHRKATEVAGAHGG